MEFSLDTLRGFVIDCAAECDIPAVEKLVNKDELGSLTSAILITKQFQIIYVSRFTETGSAVLGNGELMLFEDFSSIEDTCKIVLLHTPLVSFINTQQSPIVGHAPMETKKTSFKDIWPNLKSILTKEKVDIWTLVAYAALASGLGLIIPLSSQSIINSVSLGVFTSQFYVLCGVVLIVMIMLAFLTVAESYIIDMIQRRLLVHTSFDIAGRLPKATHESVRLNYTPDLVNRFFDVMTIQKSLAKFLLDGVNGVLILISGLVLLAFYHPFFIIYDLLFLFFVPVLVMLFGRGAIGSAAKYQAAASLEDIARAQLSFKLNSASAFGIDRINRISLSYIDAKRAHFFIVARQLFCSYIFKAVAVVGILGVGGGLVLAQQLSLGQLVAAEIVILMIISALEKLLGQFDSYYDMMAALDKLSFVMNQPLETVGGISITETDVDIVAKFTNVQLSFNNRNVLQGLNLE
ncbi:MAG: ABC transporter ATP-binding protein [Ignavibacteria bacterium]|nr:ABC transporter ATP-binding protein [Ignavibacteria bacterium]